MKQHASLEIPLTSPTPTSPPAIPTSTTNEHRKKTTKPKIAVVGDSNARSLYKHLDHTVTDTTVWVNAGCKAEDVKSRARDIPKDSDIGVIHLRTNDALSNRSDNDCLVECSDAMDSILDYSEQTPLIVCSVQPTRSKTGQRRVRIINTLLKYKCHFDSILQQPSIVEYQAVGGGKRLADQVNQLTLECCHSFRFYGSCRKRIPIRDSSMPKISLSQCGVSSDVFIGLIVSNTCSSICWD